MTPTIPRLGNIDMSRKRQTRKKAQPRRNERYVSNVMMRLTEKELGFLQNIPRDAIEFLKTNPYNPTYLKPVLLRTHYLLLSADDFEESEEIREVANAAIKTIEELLVVSEVRASALRTKLFVMERPLDYADVVDREITRLVMKDRYEAALAEIERREIFRRRQ